MEYLLEEIVADQWPSMTKGKYMAFLVLPDEGQCFLRLCYLSADRKTPVDMLLSLEECTEDWLLEQIRIKADNKGCPLPLAELRMVAKWVRWLITTNLYNKAKQAIDDSYEFAARVVGWRLAG